MPKSKAQGETLMGTGGDNARTNGKKQSSRNAANLVVDPPYIELIILACNTAFRIISVQYKYGGIND